MSERDTVNCRPLGFVSKFAVAWGGVLLAAAALWCAATMVANHRLSKALAKWQAAGLPLTVEELRPQAVADADNAAKGFLAAAAMASGYSPAGGIATFDLRYLPYPNAWWELANSAAVANGPVYAAAIAAAKLPQSDWGVDPTKSPMTVFPLDNARELANLLSDEAIRRHLLGDDAGAFDLLEAQARLAETLAHEPSFEAYLTAIGIEQSWLDAMPQLAASLKIGNAAGEVPVARVRQMVTRLKASKLAIGPTGWAGEYLTWQTLWNAYGNTHVTVRPVATAALAATATQLIQSFDSARAARAGGDDNSGPFNAVHNYKRLMELSRKRVPLSQGIAAAALMAAVFRAEHGGAWPETGEAMATGYGEPLPVDPYRSDGGPLNYFRFGPQGRVVLRGVGTDGTLPESPPSIDPALTRQPSEGPRYSWIYIGPNRICVWIDLMLYPRPTTTAPSGAP